jgi:TonB-linked SusC/RagA family outer membrane protein
MKKKLLLLLLMVLTIQVSMAQQRAISGVVIDAQTKEPLPGANVYFKNSKVGSSADATGKFKLNVPEGSNTIIASFVGYSSSEVAIGNLGNITVALNSNSELSEVVVTGYLTEKKKDLKGAVTVVKVGDALKETNANIITSLQSRVPGVDINTDGAPGSGITINVRGLASFNNNTPPLFIVDGVPTYDINGLSQNDIESLQVLKDAASAAIYGARGSSGVIVITTKKGKSSQVKVTFDAFYGVKTLRNKLSMLDAQGFGNALWQGFKNDGIAPNDPVYGNGPSPVIPAFIDAPNNTTPSGNTDWIKEVFQPAANSSYNLGLNKASEKSTFYLGLNYNKEEGLMKNTFYERMTARMNSSFKASKAITFGQNFSIAYLRGNRENEGRALEASVVQLPIIPLYDNKGNWAGPFSSLGDYRNPLGDLTRYKDNVSSGIRLFGNLFAEVELLKGLSYKSSFAIDYTNSGQKFFENRYVMGRFSSDANKLTQSFNTGTNLTATNTLSYDFKIGEHEFQSVVGYEWIHNMNENSFAIANNFFIENPNFIYLGSGTPLSSGGSGAEYGLIGQFGKINYNYKGKYLLGASLRRDGSSRFGKDFRYGTFASASAAWRLSAEEFMKDIPTISDLKLRASWGQNGNDNIKNYNYATFFGPSIDYGNYDIFGKNVISDWNNSTGFIVSSLGNPNTKWEAVEQTNIGIDLGLFEDRLYFTADYYIKKSKDLLYQVQLPAVIGEGTRPFINVGDIENKGFELLASYKSKRQSKFNYTLDLSFTSNSNKVLSVGLDGNDVQYPGQHIIKKGLALGEFFGYINDGIFKTQAEVDAAPAQDGKAVGMLRFRDIDGDGKITDKDRTNLGSPLPKFTFGLNTNITYGKFDLNMFWDSKVGQKIFDQSKMNTDFLGYTSNHSTDILNAWTPSNPNATIPILTNNNANFNKVNSSYFVSDASFVRLKSIALGYTLPDSFMKKLGLSQARVYVQAQNYLTFTNFKGYDFETLNADLGSIGVTSLAAYPHSKALTVGISTSF